MRYLIMEGDDFCMLALPARQTREEAEKEAQRLEELRLKRNKEAAEYVWKERGDAFRRPFHSDKKFWVKEIPHENQR